MGTADEAFDALRKIKWEFREFCKSHGAVTEADTRAKVIDKVIQTVLIWPESQVTREDHVARGYMDYCLSVKGRRFVAVEAKRAGTPFTFPYDKHQRSLKLSGPLSNRPTSP